MVIMQNGEERPQVLIVDDDMAQRLLMRQSLHNAGVAIEEAADGLQALELFNRLPPDLVLMDVKMPRMDGFTACSEMRKSPGGQDLAIVLVTGLDDYDSIQRAFEAGATDFITKPVNWPLLAHRVRYLLRASQAFCNLRRSEKRLSIAQRIAALGSWDWDRDKDSIFFSPQMHAIFGLAGERYEVDFAAFHAVIHPDERREISEVVRESLAEKKPYSIDYRIILPNGFLRTVHEQADVLHDDQGNPISMHGTVQDITERINAEEKIRFLAHYDPLTGLPNRQLFLEYANQALFGAQREGCKVALLFLDLDRFKRINDTLGHSAGDVLLKKIASCLGDSVRSSDIIAKACFPQKPNVTLSRLGGDEFTILLTSLAEEGHAALIARRILELLSLPVNIAGQDIYVSASIGITIFPGDGEDVDTLLKNADIAMYHAKENGRNTFQFFSEQMNHRAMERLNIETALKKGVERNELVLHYQPQIDLRTGTLAGLEALVRWMHPLQGLIAPGKFIPIAEESGLIINIGEWVIRQACKQARLWQEKGLPPVHMAINISSLQFKQQNLIPVVEEALRQNNLDPRNIELELTESSIMQNVDQVNATLNRLKQIGVALSVDDFGTGYSSMSYLKRFPLDALKIDRSFVMDITTDPNDAAIIKAIIALARSLGLETVAEGVETAEQLEFLRQQQCDFIQGYYVGRPAPAEDIEQLLLPAKKFC